MTDELKPEYALDIASRFNECINNGDLDGLAMLMTPDHLFIDMAGGVVTGIRACLMAWAVFFAAFPDYQNHFTGYIMGENFVKMVGHSTCSDPRLEGKALWSARIRNNKISEWRVYEDTLDNRELLGI